MQTIYERYRPTDLAGVLGQPKAVAVLSRLAGRGGYGGRAYWLSGPSGSGKTTLAKIIARSVADDWTIIEYDSADVFGAEAVEEMRRGFCLFGAGQKGGRAWIVNEAHGLRKPVIRMLLGLLEPVPAHCVVCFTTTRDGEDQLFDDQIDAAPLLSRCVEVRLTNQGLSGPFAARAAEIARLEGLDGQREEYYARLAKVCKSNMRAMLQRIEAGEAMKGGE